MRAPLFALLLLAVPALAASPAPQDTRTWHRLVGILQYLEADYPMAVESKSEFELAEQRSFAAEAVEALKEIGPAGAGFVPRMLAIKARVDRAEEPEAVSHDCGRLAEELVLAGGLTRSPRQPPSLERGAQVFAASCTACHGADGSGKVPIAETMEPRPANFLDGEVMGGLMPYKAFNTTSFGVTGTAMAAFPTLSDEDRWSVAFYLFTLRQPGCDHKPPRVTLEELATSTDADLVAKYGEKELACLRRTIPDVDEERSLLIARGGVEDALRLAAEGNATAARQALLDAYLMGLEPVEAKLRMRGPTVVDELEKAFLRTRVAFEQGSPRAADEGKVLLSMLDKARRSSGGTPDFLAVLGMTLLILLREGFEATVVVAALLAALKKMGTPDHARVVHVGWVSALLVGAVAFLFGRHLLAGANQELMEGVVALVAVAMLLYAALWLNARANIRVFMGELRQKMQGALGRGSMASLFIVSFSAVLRESFETAVFLQGLAVDSVSGVAWGSVAGVLLMLGFVFLINRVGYVLPMKTLFSASTVLLVATAVVLLGKGLHALQEVGMMPLAPIGKGSFSVEFLGVYADVVSLVPQLVLTLVSLAYVGLHRMGWWPGSGS
ncbi:MAG: FTR1 family protein, partial [Myxococcaceae bacterium]|nr:FTR1 family protein [Myxococcaceae bacterium]